MLCPAAALVLLLHHHGQAAHVFVILAIPYLIGMPRIDLGACFAPSGCLLVVTTGSNRPKAVIVSAIPSRFTEIALSDAEQYSSNSVMAYCFDPHRLG